MGSLANPPTWPPFSNIRDCSQGICNSYCSQWCYRAVFPPPPPMMNTATAATFLLTPTESDDSSNISPFVVAIIGILTAAFLLVVYYTVTSRYCSASANPPTEPDPQRESIDTADEVVRDAGGGGGGSGGGVEDSLIKSITVCRYKKGEAGVMGITDCSVCLAEFQHDESLRLLPKCCHAFHVRCIDTWLRSNSSCPLCRAHILPLPLPPHMAAPQVAEARRSSDHTCVTIGDLKQGGPAMVGEGPSTVEKSKNSGSGSSGV